ncbi:MAG: hypothetical protein JXQ89_08945 [Pelagimonas sp.]
MLQIFTRTTGVVFTLAMGLALTATQAQAQGFPTQPTEVNGAVIDAFPTPDEDFIVHKGDQVTARIPGIDPEEDPEEIQMFPTSVNSQVTD